MNQPRKVTPDDCVFIRMKLLTNNLRLFHLQLFLSEKTSKVHAESFNINILAHLILLPPSTFLSSHTPNRMNLPNWKLISFSILLSLLQFAAVAAVAAAPKQQQVFSFINVHGFNEKEDGPSFENVGDASIDGGALQLTPDTMNDNFSLYNKSGRTFYYHPFDLWLSDDDDFIVSFASYFVINIYRNTPAWNAGNGLAFLIAPDLEIPDASYGQWLGLTNASTDGSSTNHIVAIEFDTEKQDFDPDDNHIGLNVNSIRSTKTVSLDDFNIEISPDVGTNYSVWIQYDGSTKVIEVYMVKDRNPKPDTPVLKETINLKNYVKRKSYFGFAASTGFPEIQLNCVLQWSLDIDLLPKDKDLTWLKIAAGVGIPVLVLAIIVGVTLGFCYMRRKRRTDVDEPNIPEKLRTLPGMPREFKYKDLKKATNNFHDSMKLGQGGFGIVYKGVLRGDNKDDGIPHEIAVKKFSRESIKGKDDFLSELAIIHRLRHKHLVRLVGWCHERGNVLLVYDFMPNGSLEKHLDEASTENILNWERRYKILTGVASALHYLHKEYDQTVVHRDLKASNIMLDSDFNARLGDFGLARVLDNGRTSYVDIALGGVPGTMGYVAPECFHTGKATPESDVFGFGAVVLEVVCGRSPGIKIEHQQNLHSLVDWVWMLHREGRILDAVHATLKNDYVVEEATMLLLLGLACSHPIADERPQTQAILQIISGTVPVPRVPHFKPVFTWPSTCTSYSSILTESSILSISLSS